MTYNKRHPGKVLCSKNGFCHIWVGCSNYCFSIYLYFFISFKFLDTFEYCRRLFLAKMQIVKRLTLQYQRHCIFFRLQIKTWTVSSKNGKNHHHFALSRHHSFIKTSFFKGRLIYFHQRVTNRTRNPTSTKTKSTKEDRLGPKSTKNYKQVRKGKNIPKQPKRR